MVQPACTTRRAPRGPGPAACPACAAARAAPRELRLAGGRSRRPGGAAGRGTAAGIAIGPVIRGPPRARAGPALLPEPANALSGPTWAVHVGGIVAWVGAMGAAWRLADADADAGPGRREFRGLAAAMAPLMAAGLCACVWHLFYNDRRLEGLLLLQAALTAAGNGALAVAAYRIVEEQDTLEGGEGAEAEAEAEAEGRAAAAEQPEGLLAGAAQLALLSALLGLGIKHVSRLDLGPPSYLAAVAIVLGATAAGTAASMRAPGAAVEE